MFGEEDTLCLSQDGFRCGLPVPQWSPVPVYRASMFNRGAFTLPGARGISAALTGSGVIVSDTLGGGTLLSSV